jgi:hypothetical protein
VTRTPRILLATLGLAAAVYATASLTGGWMGTPPWWEREVVLTLPIDFNDTDLVGSSSYVGSLAFLPRRTVPRLGREVISASISAVGLALLAWAAWPRRKAGGSVTSA